MAPEDSRLLTVDTEALVWNPSTGGYYRGFWGRPQHAEIIQHRGSIQEQVHEREDLRD